MFSLLGRRVLCGVFSSTTPRLLFNTAIRPPIFANRSFTTTQRTLLAQVKPVSRVKAGSVPKTTKKPAVRKSATKKTTKKGTVVKAKKVRKAKPKPEKSILRTFKPPPRKVNGYSMFVRHRGVGLKGPMIPHSRRVGQEWRALPDSEKQVFVERARVEKVALDKRFAEFMSDIDAGTIRKYNKERRKIGKTGIRVKKSPDQKGPLRPFFKFMAEVRIRPEYKLMKMPEIAREAGRQWRSLNEADKSRYF